MKRIFVTASQAGNDIFIMVVSLDSIRGREKDHVCVP